MMDHYPDPERWSPKGDPEADAERLGLIHAAALSEDAARAIPRPELNSYRIGLLHEQAIGYDCRFSHGAYDHSGCQLATVPALFLSDYERRQAAALASTAGALAHAEALSEDAEWERLGHRALAQADGDPGEAEGWDLLLDYDRDHDVPGMILPHGPFWAGADETDGAPLRVIEIMDGEPDPHMALHILTARLERAGHTVTDFDMGRSTNGWHMKLRLDPRPSSCVEAVALQAILGSDPLRESCNLQRAREVDAWGDGGPLGRGPVFWRDRWNVLYRPNAARRRLKP